MGFSRIKHVLLCVVRAILVIAAPHFAFSQAARRGAERAMTAPPLAPRGQTGTATIIGVLN